MVGKNDIFQTLRYLMYMIICQMSTIKSHTYYFSKECLILTDWIDSKGRVRWCTKWTSSCTVVGCNSEFILCAFKQTSHLKDRKRKP